MTAINPMFAVMAGLPTTQAPDYPLDSKIPDSERTCPDDPEADPGNFWTWPQYPDRIGGLYSDNIVTPMQVKAQYIEQIVKAGVYAATPLSEAMLAPENIEFIRREIQSNIIDYTGDKSIRYLLHNEFVQSVIDAIAGNQAYAFDVKNILPALNDWIVHQETQIALLSLRHWKRYDRWMLNNDRSRIMPYGLPDATLHHRKGERAVSSSGYSLNHPWHSQYQAYLRDVLHIQCCSPSTAPDRVPIPSYLKFASP